ncbi:hypothetical protein J0J30_23900, partial [Vibrio vulnificus]|nr:hypothetical protein [Vibrio vulnificus]
QELFFIELIHHSLSLNFTSPKNTNEAGGTETSMGIEHIKITFIVKDLLDSSNTCSCTHNTYQLVLRL